MKDNFDAIISRNTLFWLLITNVAVLSPLYQQATLWSIGICAICFVWRVGIYLGKVAAPPKLLVTSLAVGAATTLALVSSEIGLLNALVNLLILGYALKYIEMREQRDVKAIVLVGYFLIALTLLDQQSMLNTLHLLAVVIINTGILVSVYQDKSNKIANLGFSVKLVLHSLPLAILLFVVFPRLGPLWMVPNIKSATTGLSDEMSFGDINKLTRSAELAFRVGFENPDGSTLGPANQDLYWRTLVMENYDGKTWRQDQSIKTIQRQAYFQKPQREQAVITANNRKIEYMVISEPSHQKWLYGLDEAFSDNNQIVELPDYRLYSLRPIDQRMSYRVVSYPNNIMELTLKDNTKQLNLALPPNSNLKTQTLAKRFAQDYPDPQTRINAMMNYFAEQAYYYTLSPPSVGEQQIDDFLFENRAGFCAHYASALVFMARASGIPARMVTGYQGGEYNPQAGYYSVYQYMAHAWTEVWLEGQGWQRFDPTAMIAPQRILDGFDATFDSQSSYLQDSPFSPLRMKQYPWLNELRQQLSSLDYYWSVWVLGFDEERKQQVLSKLLGDVTSSKIALMMILSFIIIALVIGYYAGLFSINRNDDPLNKRYNLICQRLAKKGITRPQGQAAHDFANHVQTTLAQQHPAIAREFMALSTAYMALKYQPLTTLQTRQHMQQFMRLYRTLRLRLLHS
ncbi:transglutaminase TgpA family protein [Shewanella basaltis]|uniref:transglutaminase TgpA family protein n=1 Tax=Shewanella basaltis TaxID=472183 RepID=UPI003AAE2E15